LLLYVIDLKKSTAFNKKYCRAGRKTAEGRIMAWFGKTKSGKEIVLLNPAEKGKRFASQLKAGKVAETGEALTDTGRAFRSGYLTARSDNTKALFGGLRKNEKEFARRQGGTYSEHIKGSLIYGVTKMNGCPDYVVCLGQAKSKSKKTK
jgi:hypothetical protein